MTRAAVGRRLRRAFKADLTRVWLPMLCLLTLLVGGMSALLLRSQEHSRTELTERYALRTALSSRFVASYVVELQTREAAHATKLLADAAIAPGRFELVSRAFGFDAALLLDSRGRVLNGIPMKPGLIGSSVAGRYEHLDRALGGRFAVSNVVLSVVRAEAIAAFAIPFDTPFGRRVFSGGVSVSESPLKAYLDASLPFKDARIYLIDGNGEVIVAGGSKRASAAVPPVTSRQAGDAVTVAGEEYRVASQPIDGTSWTT